MKAILYEEHGTTDVLDYRDVSMPSPGPGEALIAVRAVSVNPGPDIETRSEGFSLGVIPLPHIGGVDPAGEIVELGPDSERFEVGDRVAVYPVIACGSCDFCLAGAGENYCRNLQLFGVHTQGGRAEYAAAPVSQLVRLPDRVSFAAAAALGVAYTTTWHGIVERGRLTPRDTLLVMGAGGGCGVAALQIAKLVGARVVAVTGPSWKATRLRELGADVVLSYRDTDWPKEVMRATDGRGVTVAFDNAGTATLPSTIRCLARGGRLICSGGTSGFELTLNLRALYRDHISLMFYAQGAKADMSKLVRLVAEGKLDPVIDKEFPLEEAADADDHVSASHQFGRVVIRVAAESSGVTRARPEITSSAIPSSREKP
jgi:NADPH:quinone reductase-like Zn-dependent oxidoreductase